MGILLPLSPQLSSTLARTHGLLMVSVSLTTLISLERARASGKAWTYLAPLTSWVGMLLYPFEPSLSVLFLMASAFFLVAIYFSYLRLYFHLEVGIMFLGGMELLFAYLLLFQGASPNAIAPWFAGFLILTIAGERLELGKMRNLSQYPRITLIFILSITLLGTILGLTTPNVGIRTVGAGWLLISLWLLRYDIALRTVRQRGLTRFIALSLIMGYFWLLMGGVLALWYGHIPAGPLFSAIYHCIFVGFVFSMIFGHAPVILPALLMKPLFYRPFFYLHLFLLHGSLIIRVAGELGGVLLLRQSGGIGNALAIGLFLLFTLLSLLLPPRDKLQKSFSSVRFSCT